MLLRLGLEIADRIVNALPARAIYALADVAGDAWRRLAPRRRRLVAANLARVCAATGRPTKGPAFATMLRDAFRNHARYYAEILRTPHYDADELEQIVIVPEWDRFEPVFRDRATLFVSAHHGNFEPFARYVVTRGYPVMAPIEVIEPQALYDFLAARRGGSAVELVPVRRSRTALTARLREGGIVGILGDRLVSGAAGHPVTMFGHPTSIPNGPALLATTTGAAVIAGRCLRIGPDRFEGVGEVVDVPSTGDRRADVATLTERLAARYEADIGVAPEQWWGAFQPFWPDIGA